jgi:hypothetical protein
MFENCFFVCDKEQCFMSRKFILLNQFNIIAFDFQKEHTLLLLKYKQSVRNIVICLLA